jgi:hypothetical membrane protein
MPTSDMLGTLGEMPLLIMEEYNMVFWGSKLSWLILASALIGDFLIAYIISFFYHGYSHTKQVMSVLGSSSSPLAVYYNVWLVVLGVLFIISSINFYMVFFTVSKNLAIIGSALLLIFGIGAGILSGIFSVNELKEIETAASKIHGIGSGLGFMALMFIPLVISMLSFKQNDNIVAWVSLLFFTLSIVFFIFFILSEKELFQNSIIGLSGMWQRLVLAGIYMPLLIIALKFIINGTSPN